jgi:hypothetical protein
MIRIEFTGDLSQVLAFREDAFMQKVSDKMLALFDKLQEKITGEKLSGQVLARRTGRLAQSVSDPEISREGELIVGELTAGERVPYAWVHKAGGTRGYTIRPVTKDFLRAMIGGKAVFRKMFEHPPLPQRAWFDPSVEEMKGEFLQGLREAVIEGFNGE